MIGRSAAWRSDVRGYALVCILILLSAAASAQQIPDIAPITSSPRSLQLDVVVNGRPTNYLVTATVLPDGGLAVSRGDLEDAGVKAPGSSRNRAEQIDLRSAGLNYRYDEAQQRLFFEVSDGQRVARIFDTRGERPPPPPPPSSAWGALLNYDVVASSQSAIPGFSPHLTGANVSLDFRAFTPYGEFTQTGIIGDTLNYDWFFFGPTSGLRLDTTYTYIDSENLLTYRAGDFINGGLPWTRPIRMGGLQVQRNFAIRPDLVTAPLPSYSGSAAVPSTVDVFVNGARSYSQQIDDGPFRITNLPVTSNGGNAQIVIRDATGQTTTKDLSLFSGQRLLADGLFDFTMETGFARRFYALRSDDYDSRPVASGSFRYGFNDLVTVEGHAEGGAGLINGSVGGAVNFLRFGSAEASVSGSRFGNATGGQFYISHTYSGPFGINLSVSLQRTFGDYLDLAALTAQYVVGSPFGIPGIVGPLSYSPVSALPPRALDRISISAPAWVIDGNVSVMLAQIKYVEIPFCASQQQNGSVLSASYSRPVPYNGNLFISAYANLSGNKDKGFFAGVTFPIGGDIQASLGAQTVANSVTGPNTAGANVQLQKSMGGSVGDYGWSINDTEGANGLRAGSASYRSALGTARVDMMQQGRFVNGTGQFAGSVAAADMSVVAGPPIDDAFGIVSVGAPGVTVLQDNRPIGETNIFGKLLVPNMRSYDRNKVSIDANSLPADALPEITELNLSPMYHSGVSADFGVKTHLKSVILVLTDAAGKPIETGSHGRLEGGEAFIVGYDGQAYIHDVAKTNMAIIDLGDRDCRATFDYDGTARTVKANCL